MKEQIKTEKVRLVLLSMLLMVCLCLVVGLTTKTVHAGSNPVLAMANHDVVFIQEGYTEGELIKLENLPADVESVDWKLDKPKLAKLDADDEDDSAYATGAYLTGKKPGTVNVTATITYYDEENNVAQEATEKKTLIVKKAVTIKHSDGIKSIKIGSDKADGVKKAQYITLYSNKKGKLKLSMKKGWKATSIVFRNGKTKKKVKNGSMINSKKSASSLSITVMDTKTKATYKATVGIEKYDAWKITYGKMKKNTMLCIVGAGDGMAFKYSKKAKMSKGQFKNRKQLTKVLKSIDASTKRNKNVITFKRPKMKGQWKYDIWWENPGKGCKVERLKTTR